MFILRMEISLPKSNLFTFQHHEYVVTYLYCTTWFLFLKLVKPTPLAVEEHPF